MLYLQMDGVDDKFSIPSISFDELIMDFSASQTGNYQKYFSLSSGGYIQVAGRPNDNWDTNTFSSVYVNGSQVTINTDFVPYDTRVTLRALRVNSAVYAPYVFNNMGSSGFMKGNLYSVKLLLGGVVKAFYDMSTGSVQDQSGNGNHATLTGGTWVDDGTGGGIDTGTPVTYTFGMVQKIYADVTTQAPLKQAIYADRSIIVPTLQKVYKNVEIDFPINQAFYAMISERFPMAQKVFANQSNSFQVRQALFADRAFSYGLMQKIYADRSWSYPMLQQIFSDYVLYSAGFPLKIIVYKDVEESFQTEQRLYTETFASYPMKQAIYKPVSVQAPTRQIIYADIVQAVPLKQVIWADRTYSYPLTISIFDPDNSIISVVTLRGQRELYAYLQGTRDLYVILKGGIPLLHGQDLSLVSGDSLYADFTLTNKDGTPIDLSGATVIYLAQQYGNPKIVKGTDTGGIAITDATNGVVRITFDPDDTASLVGEYSHEMRITDSQGHVTHVMDGKLTIAKSYIQ